MDKAALLALADRVEALTGPDREVDALISATARTGYGIEFQWALKYPAWIGGEDGRVHLEKNGPSFAPPAYTASIDAAMTLVPNDVDICTNSYRTNSEHEYVSYITDKRWNEEEPDGVFEQGDGHSLAAAITAAALRARASQ